MFSTYTKTQMLSKATYTRLCLLFLLSIGIINPLSAQCDKCLTYAKDVLSSPNGEDGRFELLPDTLQVCLEKGTTTAQKQEALLLLTEAYIFMKQEANADTSYLKVLKKNPIYSPEAKDEDRPIEVIQFARKFRSTPLISVELRAGVNTPMIKILERYNTDCIGCEYTSEPAPEQYKTALGIQAGLLVNYHPTKLINVSTGLFYSNRKYKYTNGLYYYNTTLGEDNVPLKLEFQESQTWLDIPLMVRVNFGNKKIIPYLYMGAEFNYLLGATYTEISRGTKKLNNYSINGQTTPKQRNEINISPIAGLGIRMKQGPHFLVFDVKYGLMTQDIVVLDKVYSNSTLVYELGHVDNHFQFHNISVTLGYQRAFYKAKKIKK